MHGSDLQTAREKRARPELDMAFAPMGGQGQRKMIMHKLLRHSFAIKCPPLNTVIHTGNHFINT